MHFDAIDRRSLPREQGSGEGRCTLLFLDARERKELEFPHVCHNIVIGG